MCIVDVSIGYNNNFMIMSFCNIKFIRNICIYCLD